MMPVNRADVHDIIYRHYPRGVHDLARIHVPSGEIFYDDTDEHQRLVQAANRGRAEYPKWKAMIARLGERFSLQNESMSLVAGNPVPAYAARIYRSKDLETVPRENIRPSLSFHVSLIGPYYGIHDVGAPDGVAEIIAAEIEATYPGYQTIPSEIGNEIVPDVEPNGTSMGEATVYICIFSKVWTWVSPVSLPAAK
jgi:hypothetical protein